MGSRQAGACLGNPTTAASSLSDDRSSQTLLQLRGNHRILGLQLLRLRNMLTIGVELLGRLLGDFARLRLFKNLPQYQRKGSDVRKELQKTTAAILLCFMIVGCGGRAAAPVMVHQ